ncbi:hypothetical protein P1J78_04045 [Psychromarinibacter sp. C21-152]|uniref:HdeA/HdeB family protein n=1 Tax=Psychromarinibacter sediminicola TaxID=3033385 RepID=A0AAE3NST0_9RHOB|nr:hypothetical protein [Psychromarinibacter sediminicola]MDF0599897.1 hypothetical protein [Psychromarinibacter sediminicola]
MKRMMAVLCMGVALPAAAQESDGVVAMCLAQGESEEVCGCVSETLMDEMDDSYGEFEAFGAAYAMKVEDEGMGPVTAWGAALDEVGMGRVQANPMGDAYRSAVASCE